MGVLPIGFFAPLPLAIMIPFMAAQSFAMGHAFGTSFQYGKRKISSMTNEEFNATDAVTIHDTLQADIRAMIPSMNESFHRMESFQIEIIQSMMNTLLKAGDAFVQFITGSTSSATSGANPFDPSSYFPALLKLINPDLTPEQIIGPNAQIAAGSDTQFIPSEETVGTLNLIEKWASKWIRKQGTGWVTSFKSATLAEIRYMITERVKGNLFPQFKSLGASLIRAEKEKMPKTLTPNVILQETGSAIVQSGLSGKYKEYAVWYSQLIKIFATPKSKWSQPHYKNQVAISKMKQINRLVAQTPSLSNKLMLDTAKSIKAQKPIPK